MNRTDPDVAAVADRALDWAHDRDYAGWDPYDGLNSPHSDTLVDNWFTRLVWTHTVNLSPVNLRPALSVPKERNPKGMALFALANLHRYEATDDGTYLDRAEWLLDWLAEYQSTRFDRPCWGYNFPWQNARKFHLPAYWPSVVVTVFAAQAFVRHHRITGDERSLTVAEGACEFIRTEINTVEIDGFDAYTYSTDDEFVVINVNALAARLFAMVAAENGSEELMARADALVTFVESAQEDSGAWHYSMPAADSHISHDNFHTGFVLESLRHYLDSGGDVAGAEASYERGLEFYREHLFEPDGAPKFEHETSKPYDAHAAAQSVVTFVTDGRPESRETARSVIEWSIENLYDEDGYFYRRRGRLLDDETPYIRWSQAWMCLALAATANLDPES